MQKKERKKKGKNPRDFHRFRVPDPNPEQFTPVPIHTGSILKFNPYEIFPLEKDGVGVVDRDLPRFPLIFLEHAPAFFFLSCQFYSKRGRSRKGTISRRREILGTWREIERKRSGEEERPRIVRPGRVHRISS